MLGLYRGSREATSFRRDRGRSARGRLLASVLGAGSLDQFPEFTFVAIEILSREPYPVLLPPNFIGDQVQASILKPGGQLVRMRYSELGEYVALARTEDRQVPCHAVSGEPDVVLVVLRRQVTRWRAVAPSREPARRPAPTGCPPAAACTSAATRTAPAIPCSILTGTWPGAASSDRAGHLQVAPDSPGRCGRGRRRTGRRAGSACAKPPAREAAVYPAFLWLQRWQEPAGDGQTPEGGCSTRSHSEYRRPGSGRAWASSTSFRAPALGAVQALPHRSH